MKPTHLIGQTNEPAIYFRPTFDVTGEMLQYCIVCFLQRDPEARINAETVKAEMYEVLKETGRWGLDPDEFKDADPLTLKQAEQFAHVLFPEFFSMTAAEAVAKYGSMPEYHLQHPKKHKAQQNGHPDEELSSHPASAEDLSQALSGVLIDMIQPKPGNNEEPEQTNGTEDPAKRRGRPRKNP